MFVYVKEAKDLRKILSQNIRNIRASLHITQTKLAAYADISVSYMIDIEHCKAWVSDKTLANIARALRMEPYELLIPEKAEKPKNRQGEIQALRRAADLIKAKKNLLRQKTGEVMDDLVLEIVRIYNESDTKSEN